MRQQLSQSLVILSLFSVLAIGAPMSRANEEHANSDEHTAERQPRKRSHKDKGAHAVDRSTSSAEDSDKATEEGMTEECKKCQDKEHCTTKECKKECKKHCKHCKYCKKHCKKGGKCCKGKKNGKGDKPTETDADKPAEEHKNHE